MKKGAIIIAAAFFMISGVLYAQEEAEAPEEEVSFALIKVHENNLLSVELENAKFGMVMAEIANRAGFELYMSGDVYEKRLTTRFQELDLYRGIIRLLGLIRQKTYFVYYNSDGSFRKLEVFGVSEVEQRKPPSTQPARRQPSSRHPVPPAATPKAPDDSGGQEPAFIPPRQAPVYIPPLPGR